MFLSALEAETWANFEIFRESLLREISVIIKLQVNDQFFCHFISIRSIKSDKQQI